MLNENAPMFQDCPEKGLVERFGRGALSEESMVELSAHLDRCEKCCALLGHQDESGDLLIAALRDRSPDGGDHTDELVDQITRQCFDVQPNHSDTDADHEQQTAAIADEPLPVIDNYDVQRLIGRGGMGAVYLAVHSSLDRAVAIKVLPKSRQTDTAAAARFRSEMKAVGRANHPNIVQALDAGQSNGTLYLALELIAGRNLSDILCRGGALNESDACEIVRQAALGLHHAHERGLIHRDIKPSNLMLAVQSEARVPGGFNGTDEQIESFHRNWVSQQSVRVKVTDLGLSLHCAPGETEDLTRSDQIMGTIEYMAPEQVLDARRVDGRADIYGLGATLYRMLTGQVPFASFGHRVTLKKLNAIAEGRFPPVATMNPGLSRPVCEFVDRLMENHVDRRFQSMVDVAAAADSLCREADLAGLLAFRWSLQPDAVNRVEFSTLNQKTFSDTESEVEQRGSRARGEVTVKAIQPQDKHQAKSQDSALAGRLLGASALLVGILALVVSMISSHRPRSPRELDRDSSESFANVIADRQPKESDFTDESSITVGQVDSERWTHLPADAPVPAIAPFTPREAVSIQRCWADYLGTDVSRTVTLPSGQSFEMRLLPPGQFEMGTSETEKKEVLARTKEFRGFVKQLLESEGPKRTAVVDRPMWLASHEVTISLFKEFVEATGHVTGPERQGGSSGMYQGASVFREDFLWHSSPDRTVSAGDPVTSISYDDATEFCNWLSKQVPEGQFELPTETQWEYACRAGSDSAYGHRAERLEFSNFESFRMNSGNRLQPVGRLNENPFGIFDLQANAIEWCRDTFQTGETRKSEAQIDSPYLRAIKVMRGGYWGSTIDAARPAVRNPQARTSARAELGFRPVSVIPLGNFATD